MKPRHFIALVPPKDVLAFLGEFQDRLRENEFYSSQVRWTPMENMHFTLRFFGDSIEDRMSTQIAIIAYF